MLILVFGVALCSGELQISRVCPTIPWLPTLGFCAPTYQVSTMYRIVSSVHRLFRPSQAAPVAHTKLFILPLYINCFFDHHYVPSLFLFLMFCFPGGGVSLQVSKVGYRSSYEIHAGRYVWMLLDVGEDSGFITIGIVLSIPVAPKTSIAQNCACEFRFIYSTKGTLDL